MSIDIDIGLLEIAKVLDGVYTDPDNWRPYTCGDGTESNMLARYVDYDVANPHFEPIAWIGKNNDVLTLLINSTGLSEQAQYNIIDEDVVDTLLEKIKQHGSSVSVGDSQYDDWELENFTQFKDAMALVEKYYDRSKHFLVFKWC